MKEIAVFGGGCFWCTEAVFQRLRGVDAVEPGYAGGERKNPTYEQVSTGATGHVEVVRIVFDPDVISYQTLLEVFFAVHDPTSLDQQGADVGTQYKSVVFTTSPQQQSAAEDYKKKLEETGAYSHHIVTKILPLPTFYSAEDVHKNYYNEHQSQPYCRLVISPKIDKLLTKYGQLVKK